MTALVEQMAIALRFVKIRHLAYENQIKFMDSLPDPGLWTDRQTDVATKIVHENENFMRTGSSPADIEW